MLKFEIDWTKLAEMPELKEFFEEDFSGFQQLVERNIDQTMQFNQEELDKLAEFRVLEVTNGCVQSGFRIKDEHSLSIEDTRACMRFIMTSLKERTMYFPSKGTVEFSAEVIPLLDKGRDLFEDAFKQHVPGLQREFYAYSIAQYIVCGRERLEAAMELVNQDYEAFFSPYYIKQGQNYIARYIACF